MTDFSKPQRMSGGAFIVMLFKNLKRFLSFFLVIFIVRFFDGETDHTDGSTWMKLLLITGGCLLFIVLCTCAQYFPYRFYVAEGKLIVVRGLLRRETTTIPLDRIHALRTRRGLIYQIVGMRGIAFDTLASKMEEVELILDESDWRNLMSLIESEEMPEAAPAAHSDTSGASGIDTDIRFSNRDLLLDALCQNHLKGMAVLGGFLAIVYNRVNDFTDNAIERIADYTSGYLEHHTFTPLVIIGLLIAAYIIVLLLWLGKVMLRNFDMSLRINRTLLTFNYGMLSRASCRFAFDKVCTIWVKRNFLEKRFGLCSLMLKQAENATAEKEEDKLKLYGRDRSASFLKWWLGKNYDSDPEIITAKSGRGVLVHTLMPALIISLVATVILCYFHLYVWVIVPLGCILIALLNGVCAQRRSRISLKESYIMVCNGRFADINNYLKYDNIEGVCIRRTPFTRWFHRVNLQLSTPGSSFTVRSLRAEEATAIYELLLLKTEQSNQSPLNIHVES